MNKVPAGASERPIAITYLSGAIRPEALNRRRDDFGVLLTPLMGNVPKSIGVHAHDNGVWSEFVSKGKKPFSLARFLAHLDKWAPERHQCLFAVAPDVVGDWWDTLKRSKPILPMIRARGYRAALVAQNGLEHHMNRIPWDDFDVLFLGGGPDPRYVTKANPKGEWKLTPGAARLVAEARRRNKDVHMGRVNSLKRLRYAQSIGCTSADGTIIAFAPEKRTPEVQGWVATSNHGANHNVTSCYVCRWKIEAWANGYRRPAHQVVESALAYQQQQLAAPAPKVVGLCGYPHDPREAQDERYSCIFCRLNARLAAAPEQLLPVAA